MCGIAAVINGTFEEAYLMGEAISSRGLDLGCTEVGNMKVAFTHLPITTDKCNQPIKKGCITMWFNGFISNWKELASDNNIEASNDTELLLEWICRDNDLRALNGFFAVLTWEDGKPYYFTDRYGIKQLYTYKQGDKTYICSEVKGIKAVVDLELEEGCVNDWKYSLGVMNPHTIYKGVRRVAKLPFKKPEKRLISYEAAKKELHLLLKQSIERNRSERLADGVFLSGGVDSGILANYINPMFSFSMDYLDELSEIDNIKRNSKGIHFTMICNQDLFDSTKEATREALDDLKAGSCFANYALTELASNYCTVLYSGAGGDEVFGGYPHRNDKPINDVIQRTSFNGLSPIYDITHDEYNWKFLEAILIVEDRMAGAFAMETRYPLLDNDFVNFALSLPDEYLENKQILKDISGLSDEVINGKKKGFTSHYLTESEESTAVQHIKFMLEPLINKND